MTRPALDIDRIYREHGSIVLRRAGQILADADEASEALQDIFVELAARPEQFAGTSSVATFLYRVTTNHCLNRLRNQRRRARLTQHAMTSGIWATHPPISVDAQEALRHLPEELARIAVYYFVDEMTQEEIAGVLGCSRRAVNKKLARLQGELEAWAGTRSAAAPRAAGGPAVEDRARRRDAGDWEEGGG
ncbi:MAG TPA: sigma-70 family RNA polymerase sigma factor [Kofleriaceae bacterium]|nr:sigma-70 family RNA polymerase sigma factor [Kofleriaceae bacterium]